ncbi:hypothetical protein HPP92_017157 [Vanilla planifolia]|uniref:Uncharacterized protein n=1 Tax=Vanilla planifolia TaxID=51239 RepID=A0A835ULP3_VANPL|nr:hypothetical protein HPP92_017157 [Vanilla planifolia]
MATMAFHRLFLNGGGRDLCVSRSTSGPEPRLSSTATSCRRSGDTYWALDRDSRQTQGEKISPPYCTKSNAYRFECEICLKLSNLLPPLAPKVLLSTQMS